MPQLSVEIRDVAERRLVTLMEILSPANKRGDGAVAYAERRLELMQTSVHLMELDLLLQGQRVALPESLPPASYYVCLSRVQRRPVTAVWAIDLRRPLPVVPVPLLPPDADVPLDLQAGQESGADQWVGRRRWGGRARDQAHLRTRTTHGVAPDSLASLRAAVNACFDGRISEVGDVTFEARCFTATAWE